MKKSNIYLDGLSYSVLVVLGSVVGDSILCLLSIWMNESNASISKTFPTIFFSAVAVFSILLFWGYISYIKGISQEK